MRKRKPKAKIAGTPAPSFSPSLSRIPGQSEWEVEEEERLQRLEEAIRCLPIRNSQERFVKTFALKLSEAFLTARHETARMRKTKTVNAAGMRRELSNIAKGAKTLAKRLKVHANVFQAWVDATGAAHEIDRQEVTHEWLLLKSLLEKAQQRAQRAAQIGIPKANSSDSRGRPPDLIADEITVEAADAYQELTGRVAVRSFDRYADKQKPQGIFHSFLINVFAALGALLYGLGFLGLCMAQRQTLARATPVQLPV
jgi:nitrate reductase assembly molybdenum cofactor insertion protein NarJ